MLGVEVHQIPIPGIVSYYEEHDARYEAGYNLIEWDHLEPHQRALEVALYRIRHSIEYQKSVAAERESKRKKQ